MQGQSNQHIQAGKLQRRLRNNPTDAEKLLWQHLRGRQIEGCKFRRQHPFLDFVLDFVCLKRQIVIEIDGGQHAESQSDAIRDRCLSAAGFTVLRFWNNQVLGETMAVLETIRGALVKAAHPHPNPPLEGEGESAEPSSPVKGEVGRGMGEIPC